MNKSVQTIENILAPLRTAHSQHDATVYFADNSLPENDIDFKNLLMTIAGLATSATLCASSYSYLIIGANQKGQITGTKFNPDAIHSSRETVADWMRAQLYPIASLSFKLFANRFSTKAFDSLTNPTQHVVIIKIQPKHSNSPEGEGVRFYHDEGNLLTFKDNSEIEHLYSMRLNPKSLAQNFEFSVCSSHELNSFIDTKFAYQADNTRSATGDKERLEFFTKNGLIAQTSNGYDISELCFLLFANDLEYSNDLKHNKICMQVHWDCNDSRPSREEIFPEGYVSGFNKFLQRIKNAVKQVQERYSRVSGFSFGPYSHDILHELLLNSLIHQDLMLGKPPLIKIFPSRIEFINPGCPRELYRTPFGKAKLHKNPELYDVFVKAGLTEGDGTGLNKVWKLCREQGIVFGHRYSAGVYSSTSVSLNAPLLL